jgi:hypothetical protein
MKGMITGLTLDDSVNDLARKFNIALEVGSLFFILLSLPFWLNHRYKMRGCNESGDGLDTGFR